MSISRYIVVYRRKQTLPVHDTPLINVYKINKKNIRPTTVLDPTYFCDTATDKPKKISEDVEQLFSLGMVDGKLICFDFLYVLVYNYAEKYNNIDVLINSRCNIEMIQDESYNTYGATCTILNFASYYGFEKVVESIIAAGCLTDIPYYNESLIIASEFGHEKIMDMLINAECSIDYVCDYVRGGALFVAVDQGNLKMVNKLIDVKCNVDINQDEDDDDNYCTPFSEALLSGNKKIVDALVNAKCSLNNGDSWCIVSASRHGYSDIVEMLINARCDVNESGYAAIHAASECKPENINVADQLIRAKCCLNVQNMYGQTELHIASKKGNENIVKLLANIYLRENYSLDTQDEDDYTAIMYASKYGHEKIVEYLIDAKCSLNLQNKFGLTALMLASLKGHENIAERLICARCLINTQIIFSKKMKDNHDQTIYSLDERYCLPSSFQLRDGMTAHDIAMGHENIANKLRTTNI